MTAKFLHPCVIITLILFCLSESVSSQDRMTTDVGITRGRNIHLWPLLLRERSGAEKKVQVLASLYQYYQHATSGVERSHLMPLYTKAIDPYGFDLRLGSTYYPSFFRYTSKTEDSVTSLKLLELIPGIDFLEYTRSAKGDFLKNNLFFFLWYKNDKVLDRGHLVVFPLYYYFRNAAEKKRFIFPMYYSKTDSSRGYRFSYVFPNVIRKRDHASRSLSILPLYFSAAKEGMSRKFVFPLYWQKRGKEHSFTGVLPFFALYRHDSLGMKRMMMTPFYWKTSQENGHIAEKSVMLFPLYHTSSKKVNYQEGQIHHETTLKKASVLPLFYTGSKLELANSDTARLNSYIVVFPLLAAGSNTTKHDSSSYVLTPVFWRSDNSKTQRMGSFPLWWRTRSRDGNSKTDVAFPLYWSIFRYDPVTTESSFYRTLFPLAGKGWVQQGDIPTRTYGNITPLYWYSHKPGVSARILVPFWFQRKAASDTLEQKARVVFPLYWDMEERDPVTQAGWRFKAFFPFYGFGKSVDSAEKTAGFISPLYWYGLRQGKQYHYILPFWWERIEENAGTKHKKHSRMLFPLYRRTREWQDNKAVGARGFITPLFWYAANDTLSRHTLFPLWWSKSSSGTVRSRSKVLFPLFWNIQAEQGQFSRKLIIVAPFFSRQMDSTAGGRQVKGNITPLYWYANSGHAHKKVLFPLWWSRHERTSQGQMDREVLFPVFWKDRYTYADGIKKTSTLVPLIFSRVTEKQGHEVLAARGNILPLYWYRSDTAMRSRLLLPLWYSKAEKRGETWAKKKAIFPFYYSAKSEKAKKQTVFPLWWHRQFIAESDTFSFHALLPLYIKTRKPGHTKTLFLPFYMRSQKDEPREVKERFGLVLYSHLRTDSVQKHRLLGSFAGWSSEGYRRSWHVFPILWSGHTQEGRFVGVLPFYYSRTSSQGSIKNIFWQAFRHKRVEGSYRQVNIMGPLVRMTRYVNGDSDFRVLHLLYARSFVKGNKLKSTFPIHYFREDTAGNQSNSYGFAFYNYFSRKIPETAYYYREQRIFWVLRIRSNAAYLRGQGVEVDRKKIRSLD